MISRVFLWAGLELSWCGVVEFGVVRITSEVTFLHGQDWKLQGGMEWREKGGVLFSHMHLCIGCIQGQTLKKLMLILAGSINIFCKLISVLFIFLQGCKETCKQSVKV